jgi:hypothetical protein
MVRVICEQPAADDSSLRQTFAKAVQFDFALHVAENLGYFTRFDTGRRCNISLSAGFIKAAASRITGTRSGEPVRFGANSSVGFAAV